MDPIDFFDYLGNVRILGILRTPVADSGPPAIDAAVAGGVRIVEISMNTAGAASMIGHFAERVDVVVGAGTVLTPDDAKRAIDQGARFLSSPIMNEPVIVAAASAGVAMIPGARTPTEMARGLRAGATVQYLFPTPADGPSYLRACVGPFVDLRLIPATGVTANDAASYLRAGAFAVGFGDDLFLARHLAERRFDLIEARARSIASTVAAVDRDATG